MSRRSVTLVAAALFATWVFFRPRTVVCPQCNGQGAPPLFDEEAEEWRARLCGTCGVSATPDLPLVGEAAEWTDRPPFAPFPPEY